MKARSTYLSLGKFQKPQGQAGELIPLPAHKLLLPTGMMVSMHWSIALPRPVDLSVV